MRRVFLMSMRSNYEGCAKEQDNHSALLRGKPKAFSSVLELTFLSISVYMEGGQFESGIR